jgi:hypothetical protein
MKGLSTFCTRQCYSILQSRFSCRLCTCATVPTAAPADELLTEMCGRDCQSLAVDVVLYWGPGGLRVLVQDWRFMGREGRKGGV